MPNEIPTLSVNKSDLNQEKYTVRFRLLLSTGGVVFHFDILGVVPGAVCILSLKEAVQEEMFCCWKLFGAAEIVSRLQKRYENTGQGLNLIFFIQP